VGVGVGVAAGVGLAAGDGVAWAVGETVAVAVAVAVAVIVAVAVAVAVGVGLAGTAVVATGTGDIVGRGRTASSPASPPGRPGGFMRSQRARIEATRRARREPRKSAPEGTALAGSWQPAHRSSPCSSQ
jgi:hypothetical protein